MRSYTVTALAIATSVAFASPTAQEDASRYSNINRRQIVTDIDDEYDFVVVGGGLAGLVMGGRLSEDSDSKVLVLEAGGDGGQYIEQINTPSSAYWGELWNDELNWGYYTVAQPELNGLEMHWPRGKVLGGSSAINGLYLTHPGEIELNAWQDMLGGMDGAENWGWQSFNAAMKKSETFTPPTAEVANTGGITYTAASRGTSGPLQVSYPGWQSPINGGWARANAAAGDVATQDAYGGDSWGAYICTSTIDPTTWTRSYSRSAYLDNLPDRANYDVLPNAMVTKVLFDESKTPLLANAVEYSTDGGKTMKKVNVKKEVILSAGSVSSPAVLMHSGIGPKDVLSAAGVDLVSELPGVGEHLQDHPSIQLQFKTSEPTVGDVRNQGESGAEFFSFVNDAVAFPGSELLFGGGAGAFKTQAKASLAQYAPDDSTVKAGYDAINKVSTDTIWDSNIGQVELLMGLTNDNSTVNMQVTLQHPFSQGRITIKNNDPFTYPVIDPQYLANPTDIGILTAGIKLIRKVAGSAPLNNILTEDFPGADTTSDADLEDFIRGNLYTEFHPSSTMAMLPKEQGGVVDANLRVYGTANVRVADASVPPIEFSSHLMGSTYGLAEKASDMIKEYWKNPDPDLLNPSTMHKSSSARYRGGSSSGGGSDNAGVNVKASVFQIFSAFFAVAACIAFGF